MYVLLGSHNNNNMLLNIQTIETTKSVVSSYNRMALFVALFSLVVLLMVWAGHLFLLHLNQCYRDNYTYSMQYLNAVLPPVMNAYVKTLLALPLPCTITFNIIKPGYIASNQVVTRTDAQHSILGCWTSLEKTVQMLQLCLHANVSLLNFHAYKWSLHFLNSLSPR